MDLIAKVIENISETDFEKHRTQWIRYFLLFSLFANSIGTMFTFRWILFYFSIVSFISYALIKIKKESSSLFVFILGLDIGGLILGSSSLESEILIGLMIIMSMLASITFKVSYIILFHSFNSVYFIVAYVHPKINYPFVDISYILTLIIVLVVLNIIISKAKFGTIEKLKMDYILLNKAEEEIRLVNKDLETVNRYLENFIYMLSHDLKTPLVSIQGFITLFNKRIKKLEIKIDPKSLHYIERIARNSRIMFQLIQDVLEFSKATEKTETNRKINVVDCVEGVSHRLDDLLIKEEINFIIENPGGFPALYMDLIMLDQIFYNLITNAIYYMGKKNSKPRKIVIRYSGIKESGMHEFQVEDTGIGIEEIYYEKIFYLFNTLSVSKRLNPNSTGIGLPLIKRILENYGGTITPKSLVGKGTIFTFSLNTNSEDSKKKLSEIKVLDNEMNPEIDFLRYRYILGKYIIFTAFFCSFFLTLTTFLGNNTSKWMYLFFFIFYCISTSLMLYKKKILSILVFIIGSDFGGLIFGFYFMDSELLLALIIVLSITVSITLNTSYIILFQTFNTVYLIVAYIHPNILYPFIDIMPIISLMIVVLFLNLLVSIPIFGTIEKQKMDYILLNKVEEEIKTVNRDLETKNKDLENFIYILSHDLKTPLVSIQGFITLFYKSIKKQEIEIGPKSLHYMDRIENNSRNMLLLIKNVLENSKAIKTSTPEPFQIVVI